MGNNKLNAIIEFVSIQFIIVGRIKVKIVPNQNFYIFAALFCLPT